MRSGLKFCLLVFLLYLRRPGSWFRLLSHINDSNSTAGLELIIGGSYLFNKRQQHPYLVGDVYSSVNVA